jgi:hypothetical protein
MLSDISTFFKTSTRNDNDATNKVRENVLKILCNPPKEYLEDKEFGESWRKVKEEWNKALKKLVDIEYTSTQTKAKGGRNSHYDADITYYNGKTVDIAYQWNGENVIFDFSRSQQKYIN